LHIAHRPYMGVSEVCGLLTGCGSVLLLSAFYMSVIHFKIQACFVILHWSRFWELPYRYWIGL